VIDGGIINVKGAYIPCYDKFIQSLSSIVILLPSQSKEVSLWGYAYRSISWGTKNPVIRDNRIILSSEMEARTRRTTMWHS